MSSKIIKDVLEKLLFLPPRIEPRAARLNTMEVPKLNFNSTHSYPHLVIREKFRCPRPKLPIIHLIVLSLKAHLYL
jgi:hypothetical protein